MANKHEALLKFGADQSELVKASKTVQKSLEKIAKVAKKSAQMMKRAFEATGRALKRVAQSIGKWFKRAMIGVAGAFAFAIGSATQFEKQMTFVSTMLSDKAMPIMDKYKKSVIDMSKEFGQSSSTLSRGLYDILSAGVNPDKAIGVLEAGAKAGVAGGTETATAIQSIMTVLNAYQMNASQAGEVSDKLFATVRKGMTDFQGLAGALGMSASTASMAGISLDELLAVTSTLTRQGINVHHAMTAVNSIINAFLKPTDDAKEVAKKFGVELSSNTLKTKGLVGVVNDLNKATAEQIAQMFPNIRGMKGIAGALKDVSGLTEDLKFISGDAYGETQKQFEKMSETAGFQLNRLKQQFISTFVALGDPMLGPFKNLIEIIMGKLANLEEWFTKNKETIKEWADKVVSAFEQITSGGFIDTIKKVGEFILREFGLIFGQVGTLLKNALLKAQYDFRAQYMSDMADIVGRKNFAGRGMAKESARLRGKSDALDKEQVANFWAESEKIIKDVFGTISGTGGGPSGQVSSIQEVQKNIAENSLKQLQDINKKLTPEQKIQQRTDTSLESKVKEYMVRHLPKDQREKYKAEGTTEEERAKILEQHGRQPSRSRLRNLERDAFKESKFETPRKDYFNKERFMGQKLPTAFDVPQFSGGDKGTEKIKSATDKVKESVDKIFETVQSLPESVAKGINAIQTFASQEESFANAIYMNFQKIIKKISTLEKKIASLKV